jgi:hypothetical protein
VGSATPLKDSFGALESDLAVDDSEEFLEQVVAPLNAL